MKTGEIIKRSFLNALGTFVYIGLIALLMFAGPFPQKDPAFVMPIFVLTLFVISASITGFLVLAKPLQLYMNGSRREAIVLFFSTLAWLILFLLLVVAALLLK